MRDVSQQIVRIAFPRGGMSQSINFFHRERVGHIIRERREIIERSVVRHELVVLHVLCDLLVAAMEKTDVRRCFGDELTIQLQHEPQNAVRSWCDGPMLSTIFSPISCCFGSRKCRVSCGPLGNRSGESISRVVNGIEG